MNYNKSLVLVPAPQSYKKTSMRDVRIFSIIIIAQITGSQGTRQRSLPEHPTPGRIFRTCIPRWKFRCKVTPSVRFQTDPSVR